MLLAEFMADTTWGETGALPMQTRPRRDSRPV
jgi:hypothetical protein